MDNQQPLLNHADFKTIYISTIKKNIMNAKDFTGGLLIGAVAGMVAGILLAPDKGSETIKKISNAAKDKFNQLKGDAEALADDAKNKANTAIS